MTSPSMQLTSKLRRSLSRSMYGHIDRDSGASSIDAAYIDGETLRVTLDVVCIDFGGRGVTIDAGCIDGDGE